MRLIVNGQQHTYHGEPQRRLSDVLRDDLGLTGTKVGCNAGDCGACTVMLGGKQVCACLTPVAQAVGKPVVTVEGLQRSEEHTSELQSLMRSSYAVFCVKK